jgi:integrase
LRAVRDPANGLAGLRPGEVTQNDVDAFTGLRRRLGGVKDGTVRRELGAMIAALNWAARGRLIGRDEVPVGLRLPPEGQARRGCLLEEDEARLWAAAIAASPARDLGPLSRVSRFVCLALATAARKEAILTLRWGQVDFGSGLIDFKDVSRVASKKRRARIPIASRLLPVLERAHFEAEDPVNGFVLDHRGEIKRAFGVFVAGLGEPFAAITPHDLRRTWATLRARRGVSMWEIAEVLGDSIATVVKHYAVHQPDHLRSAVE